MWTLSRERESSLWPPATFASQRWFWNLKRQSLWLFGLFIQRIIPRLLWRQHMVKRGKPCPMGRWSKANDRVTDCLCMIRCVRVPIVGVFNSTYPTRWCGHYGALHAGDWEPVTITLQALSLVGKAEPVRVCFTLRSRDQWSMWMQEKWSAQDQRAHLHADI